MNKSNTNIAIIIILVILAVVIGTIIAVNFFNPGETIDKNKCEPISIQNLHNDYIDNEITAKDKYTGNLYSFTGEIYDINEFLNDKYIVLRYVSDRNQYNVIEVNAYFDSAEDLKDVKKGDNVTIYGRFKERSIENYMNTITSYTFKSCIVEKNQ